MRAAKGPSTRRLLSVVACASFRLPPAPSLEAALHHATEAFEAAAVPEPRLSAEHLLTRCASYGKARGALAAALSRPLDAHERDAFEAMCSRRLARVPVQYILGDWDFHELTLRLEPPILIPRPETEELVQHVLGALRDSAEAAAGSETLARQQHVLDVGCGSGAIGLALLHQLRGARCTAVDVSAQAAALAARNAEELGLAARYAVHCAPVDQFAAEIRAPAFDLLVANPPYIPEADMAALAPEVARYEDRRALCGGADGLDIVRQIVAAAPLLLRPDGTRAIWLEVDPSHPAALERWLVSEAPELRVRLCRTLRDAGGLERFCELRWLGADSTAQERSK